MKDSIKKTNWIQTIKTLCTMIGTVVGAGFVSGRELLQFFGTFRISTVYYAGILFFFHFLLYLKLGQKFGGFQGVLKKVFKRFSHFVKFLIFIGSFLSCVGMLSGINALFPQGFPFISMAFLLFSCFISEHGVKGIGTANLLLMPLILLITYILIFKAKAYSAPESHAANVYVLFSVYLYVSMNAFLSAPVLCDMGAEIKQPTFLCLVTSFVIAVTIGVILSAVSSDKSCYVYDLPLFHILNEAKIFRFLAAGGMFTSLISSFYPLYDFAAKRGKVFGKCLLVVFTLAFSIVPFQTIVSSVYPSIGVAGIALTAICTAVYLHNKGYAVKRKKKFYYKNRKRFYCHKRKKVI